MRQNENNRADRLLGSYFQGGLPEPLNETLLGWFVSDDHVTEKEAALAQLFDDYVRAQKTPDRNTLRSLVQIHKRLGLPEALKKVRPLIGRRIAIGVAAALIPLLLVVNAYLLYTVYYKPATEPVSTSIVAEVPQDVELPDGSKVHLGEGSELTYDEGGRSVNLRGEAKFEVKKAQDATGAALPFTVETKELKVEVLGTVFRVIDHDSVPGSSIALYDGSVRVAYGAQELALRVGDVLHYDPEANSGTVSIISAREMIDNDAVPVLRFEMSSRANLILSFEANYGVKFTVPEGVDLETGAIWANFENLPLEENLQSLTLLDELYSYELNGSEIRITKK